MLNRISEFFWRLGAKRPFYIALAAYLVFGAVVMPYCANLINKVAGKQTEILDLQFGGYDKAKAMNIIGAYGDEGRPLVIKTGAIADGIYPVVYTMLLVITIAWLYKATGKHGMGYNYIHLLPFLVMITDYCENISIIRLINQYPDLSDSAVEIASFFTKLKWGLLWIVLAVMVLGLVLVFTRKKLVTESTDSKM